MENNLTVTCEVALDENKTVQRITYSSQESTLAIEPNPEAMRALSRSHTETYANKTVEAVLNVANRSLANQTLLKAEGEKPNEYIGSYYGVSVTYAILVGSYRALQSALNAKLPNPVPQPGQHASTPVP